MNPYTMLGIDRSATKEEIKKAYRKLALLHHPDRGGDENKFKEITQAHTILSDDGKRQHYDMTGSIDDPMPGHPAGFNPFDLFGGMFRRPEQQPTKLEPKIVPIEVDLEEAYTGTTIRVNVSVEKRCTCVQKCTKCNGTGKITAMQAIGPFQQMIQLGCDRCRQSGTLSGGCTVCHSTGQVKDRHEILLDIPEQCPSEWERVYPDWGHQPRSPMEQAGDLILRIKTKTHVLFHREQNHLVYRPKLSLIDSLIGPELVIPFFIQDIKIRLSQWGPIDPRKDYIIPNCGMKNEKNEIGNLILRFDVQYQSFSPDVQIELHRIFSIVKN